MTYIGKGACGGDWCGAPPLVWVELAPLAFLLDPAVVVEVLLLTGRWNWTYGMSLKASCSGPSVMVVRFWWVDCGWRVGELHLRVTRGDCRSLFLVALSGSSSTLKHGGRQILGFKV
jgi:hypothetical protein